MYRKFLAALVALTISVGAVFADEIKAVFVKYADGKLVVKVDDKEKEYKANDDTKVKAGKRDSTLGKAKERMKEGTKLTLTVEKDEVTLITFGKQ